MTPEQIKIKDQWVSALRSGEYQQGKGALNCNGQLCCLGVLCEVAIENGLKIEKIDREYLTLYDHCTTSLPRSVMNWSGLHSASGRSSDLVDDRTLVLSAENDNGSSFVEIADLIEKHADVLFG